MRLHQSQRRHEILMHNFSLLCPLIFFKRQQINEDGTHRMVAPVVQMPGCYRDHKDFRVFPGVALIYFRNITPGVSAATQEPA